MSKRLGIDVSAELCIFYLWSVAVSTLPLNVTGEVCTIETKDSGKIFIYIYTIETKTVSTCLSGMRFPFPLALIELLRSPRSLATPK